jgi:hypothetical protein
MAMKAHFDKESLNGWWAGDYGERICEWTYFASTREIDVRCRGKIEGKRIALPMTLESEELERRLSRLAIDLAGKILGRTFDA